MLRRFFTMLFGIGCLFSVVSAQGNPSSIDFGGMYRIITECSDQTPDNCKTNVVGCDDTNPMTADCSCPAGFLVKTAAPANCWEYSESTQVTRCLIQFYCYKLHP